MTLSAIWAALSSRMGRWAVAIAAGLLFAWRVVAGIKRDAVAGAQAGAAKAEADARRRGDAAAAEAEREGARKRLEEGRF